MKSRKAASLEPGDQPQAKRRKTDKQNSKAESRMDIVSDECLVPILSILPVDDLNTVALCNRRFRDARTAIRSTKLAQAVLSFPRDRPRSPCSMQSSKTTGKMFSLVIERSLSLWESNICDTRRPFPSLQDWWRERNYREPLFSMPLSLTMNDSCVGLVLSIFLI